MYKKELKKQKGIALLMAVLVSGLFFVISAAIYKISLIELVLSSTGKDSQFAFYAADGGVECGLYWDSKYVGGVYGDPSAFSIDNNGNGDDTANRQRLLSGTDPMIYCGGAVVTGFRQGDVVGGGLHQTYFKINQQNICSEVVVSKFADNSFNPATYSSGPAIITTITSHGYNTCDATNPRRVERAIKVTRE